MGDKRTPVRCRHCCRENKTCREEIPTEEIESEADYGKQQHW